MFLNFYYAGTRAKTSFENLKKNYTKKRSNLRGSKKSGTSRAAVEKAEFKFNQLSFLVWLGDFIRPRTSRSSIDGGQQLSDDGDSLDGDTFNHSSFNEHDDHDDDEDEETSQRIDETLNRGVAGPTLDITETQSIETTSEAIQIIIPKKTQTPVIKKTAASKRKMIEATETSQIDAEKLSFLKTINQRMEAREKKKPEDVKDRYSVTIADRLRDLPQRERLMAKHEIENTLFKYQLQALDKKNNNNSRGNPFPLQQMGIGMPDQTTQQQFFNNFQQQHQQQQQPMSPTYSQTPMPSPSQHFQSNVNTSYEQS